jgi:L-glyceraldehyde 3-phosphate reductase
MIGRRLIQAMKRLLCYLSLAQMSLAWVLRGGRITSAIIGASKVSQIEENVGALMNLEFSDEELLRIEEILNSKFE